MCYCTDLIIIIFHSSLLKHSLTRKPSVRSLVIESKNNNSAIKPTEPVTDIVKETLNGSIRHFSTDEITVCTKHVVGGGRFGKCFLGLVGPLQACVKVLRSCQSNTSFVREANIILSLCHSDVSYLFGVCLDTRHRMLLIAFHGIDYQSFTLHSELVSKSRETKSSSISWDWRTILLGIITGMHYIHGVAAQTTRVYTWSQNLLEHSE